MKDQAIDEIRERRRDLFTKKYGGSIEQMVSSAMKTDSRHPAKVVRAPVHCARHHIPAYTYAKLSASHRLPSPASSGRAGLGAWGFISSCFRTSSNSPTRSRCRRRNWRAVRLKLSVQTK